MKAKSDFISEKMSPMMHSLFVFLRKIGKKRVLHHENGAFEQKLSVENSRHFLYNINKNGRETVFAIKNPFFAL